MVVGLLVLAYAAAVLFWRDPVTDLYSRYQQNRLESALEEEFAAWDCGPARRRGRGGATARGRGGSATAVDVAASRGRTAADARRFTRSLEQGQAFGRVEILPRSGSRP